MEEKIIKIMEEILKERVTSNSIQKECVNWDSLHHLSLIIMLENEFDISFEPEEISFMTSFNKISEIIRRKKNV